MMSSVLFVTFDIIIIIIIITTWPKAKTKLDELFSPQRKESKAKKEGILQLAESAPQDPFSDIKKRVTVVQ